MSLAYNGMGRRSTPVSDMNFKRHPAKAQYSRVTCILIRRAAHALLIHHKGQEHWIPLSLIHGGDVDRLDPDTQHEPQTFKLMEWKAKELGL